MESKSKKGEGGGNVGGRLSAGMEGLREMESKSKKGD